MLFYGTISALLTDHPDSSCRRISHCANVFVDNYNRCNRFFVNFYLILSFLINVIFIWRDVAFVASDVFRLIQAFVLGIIWWIKQESTTALSTTALGSTTLTTTTLSTSALSTTALSTTALSATALSTTALLLRRMRSGYWEERETWVDWSPPALLRWRRCRRVKSGR